MAQSKPPVPAAWAALKHYTPARIALGRSGNSLPTAELLKFQLAHGRARDAVYAELDGAALLAEVAAISGDNNGLCLASRAANRRVYLQRPDLGRRLAPESAARLEALARPAERYELALIAADGLSALAVQRHLPPLLARLLPALRGWRLAPFVCVTQGRVAVADEIGALLAARISLILIGERPGLTSPDSLGAYLTFGPKPGNTDEKRNCVSNIRPEGLSYDAAARTLAMLLDSIRRRALSGVGLKLEEGGTDRLE